MFVNALSFFQVVIFFFSQDTFCQCIGTPFLPEAYSAIGTGIPNPFTSQLTMHIPTLPAPMFSILSDNLIVDGTVSVSGSLPFIGAVSLEGQVPTVGEASVMYNCGNGEIGMERTMPTRLPYGL